MSVCIRDPVGLGKGILLEQLLDQAYIVLVHVAELAFQAKKLVIKGTLGLMVCHLFHSHWIAAFHYYFLVHHVVHHYCWLEGVVIILCNSEIIGSFAMLTMTTKNYGCYDISQSICFCCFYYRILQLSGNI